LWNLKVNERLKLMLWKIAWESLPTKEFIGNRIHLDDINCPHCNSQIESVVHLFFECPIAVIIWWQTKWPLNLSSSPRKSAQDWIRCIIELVKLLGIGKDEEKSFSLLAAILCDRIWWHRNKMIFDKISPTPLSLVVEINKSFISYSEAWASKSPNPRPSH
jgi:hypothetical protein